MQSRQVSVDDGANYSHATRRMLLSSLGALGFVDAVETVAGERGGVSQTQDSGSWSQFQYNSRNTGYYPSGTGVSGDLSVEWVFEMEGANGGGSPVLHDGTVYGTGSSVLYAVAAETGEPEWQFTPDRGFVYTLNPVPAIDSGRIIVEGESNIYALDITTGDEIWRASVNGVTGYVTVASGTVYIAGSNRNSDHDKIGVVTALNVADGSKKWSFEFEGWVSGAPAVTSTLVVVGGQVGEVYGISPDGTKQWQQSVEAPVAGSPSIADGRVHIGTGTYREVGDDVGSIRALDSETGKEIWRFETEGPFNTISTVTVTETTCYAISDNGSTLYALDKANGTKKWQFATEFYRRASPVIVGDNIYATGFHPPAVYKVDPETGTGEVLWQGNDSAGAFRSTITVGDQMVFGKTDSNTLYALTGPSPEQQVVTKAGERTETTEQTVATDSSSVPVFERFGGNPSLPLALGGGGLLGAAGLGAYRWWSSENGESDKKK